MSIIDKNLQQCVPDFIVFFPYAFIFISRNILDYKYLDSYSNFIDSKTETFNGRALLLLLDKK